MSSTTGPASPGGRTGLGRPPDPPSRGLDTLLEDAPPTAVAALCALGILAASSVVFGVAALAMPLPSPGPILLVSVVWAAFVGGTWPALAATVTTTALYAVYLDTFTTPLGAHELGVHQLVGLAIYAAVSVGVALLVGALRQRGERRVARERALRERQADLEHIKSHFLNVASHELRSPLAVARGYASMLADGSFGPPEASDIRQAIPVMMAKLEQMNALVDSMLDAARLEERQLMLKRTPLDLGAVVDGAVRAALPSLTPAHDLRWRRPRAPIAVEGDEARLAIIITNLIINAIKYSPAGGTVDVFLTEDGDRAALSVWDHGLGIAESDLPRLFSRFGRIVTPHNSHILGTGLGLYLARELARLHGGDIVVASARGRGSTFTLVLPLASTPPRPLPPEPEDAGAGHPAMRGVSRRKARAGRARAPLPDVSTMS